MWLKFYYHKSVLHYLPIIGTYLLYTQVSLAVAPLQAFLIKALEWGEVECQLQLPAGLGKHDEVDELDDNCCGVVVPLANSTL